MTVSTGKIENIDSAENLTTIAGREEQMGVKSNVITSDSARQITNENFART